MVHAGTCYAPDRPFVPADPDTAKEYADLIKRDFETYINDVQAYFRCLEIERGRAFTEAQMDREQRIVACGRGHAWAGEAHQRAACLHQGH